MSRRDEVMHILEDVWVRGEADNDPHEYPPGDPSGYSPYIDAIMALFPEAEPIDDEEAKSIAKGIDQSIEDAVILTESAGSQK